jgi:hypothetical protein
MLFASTGVLSVEREVEDKITLWCQQEKSSNEYLNKFLLTESHRKAIQLTRRNFIFRPTR